jgi:hypothetical protein
MTAYTPAIFGGWGKNSKGVATPYPVPPFFSLRVSQEKSFAIKNGHRRTLPRELPFDLVFCSVC